ncbi:hypothetical protein BO86DRAFT_152059 [Aspergillus japonicus CBS 114.51]|uniref:Uncharacterized protein n=2 Tax=Aspergillus TaxID=5052 RepID=A0A2V5HGZ2_ASPV1|nr:hypothetical protein BO86DRAFT_152059 [Aspergillus japonicus CBS 114.51]PYI23655.1 hypothetical protein BO99DRAFT_183287 [Aspergillus violaceofuscus CBS 115571]RAH79455.1 hypothetical protein BO86DRAFT_152059 [Aspergillus japonicus CBS 114.51]
MRPLSVWFMGQFSKKKCWKRRPDHPPCESLSVQLRRAADGPPTVLSNSDIMAMAVLPIVTAIIGYELFQT